MEQEDARKLIRQRSMNADASDPRYKRGVTGIGSRKQLIELHDRSHDR